MAYRAAPPRLGGLFTSPASNSEVAYALHRCLSPDRSLRPTAADLRAILSGRFEGTVPISPSDQDKAASAPAKAAGAPAVSEILELQSDNGKSLQVRVRTELNRTLMQHFGPDSQFWDARQCVLERNARGQWVLSPIASATNDTLLNGRAVTEPELLNNGDVVAVGRQAKGIVKLPLTVRGR